VTEGPEARIRAGSPTPEVEVAVLAAIERIWLDERAKAATAIEPSGWVTAARLEGTRRTANTLRGARIWRLSGTSGWDAPTTTQTGRGDAK
jgi:hypothetical protein